MRRKQELSLTLPELAERLGARLELPADTPPENIPLTGLSTLESAHPHDLAFIGGERYRAAAQHTRAGALLVTEADRIAERPCLVVPHVWKAALAAFDLWYPDIKPAPGVHPSAVVDPTAQIHPTASIGPLTVVEAGARVGAQVEIGANTTIDRAFLHTTRIGAGSKIDNLVQIAHNVQIGRCCGLASQVGVAGSTVVGDGVIMWGQVGVPDHIRIGDRAVLLAKSGPKESIEAG